MRAARLALLGLLAGCHPTAPADPLPSVRRYLDLTADGQVDAAYAMLSESFRARCDRACFDRILLGQRQELLQARAQVRAGEARVETQAQLTLADGSVLKLVRSADGPGPDRGDKSDRQPPAPYLFADNPLDFYPQDTPDRALRSFARAVESRRYEALLRFIPAALGADYSLDALRQRFDGPGRPALLAQLAAIARHLHEPFVYDRDGRTAKLPVGDGKEARLTFEEGRWRVLQLE